jgi:ABC-type antimicrobial peptide transport system permease subunit
MNLKKQISLAYKFLLPKKWQYILVFLGILIGSILLFIFTSVTIGLQKSINNSFSDSKQFITIKKDPNKDQELNEKLFNELKSSNLIDKIYKQTSILLPFSFSIPIPFTSNFDLDLYFLYGLDDELFNDIKKYDSPENSIPVFINPLSVDLINSFIQSLFANISFSTEILYKRSIDAKFGNSVFLPTMNRSKTRNESLFISGFSSFAPLIGLSIPLSKAREIQTFFGDSITSYSHFHILPKKGVSLNVLYDFLDSKNIFVKKGKGIETMFNDMVLILQIVLLFSAGVITILSFLFLFSVLHIVFIEHKKTIGILQAMGFSNKIIGSIFALQGGIVVIFSVLFGGIFGILFLSIIKKWWENSISLFLFPSSVFKLDINIFLLVFGLVLVVAFIPIVMVLYKHLKTPVLHNLLKL